jgi:hypothetical protein
LIAMQMWYEARPTTALSGEYRAVGEDVKSRRSAAYPILRDLGVLVAFMALPGRFAHWSTMVWPDPIMGRVHR